MNRSLALLLGLFTVSMTGVCIWRLNDGSPRSPAVVPVAAPSPALGEASQAELPPQPLTPQDQLEAALAAIWLETPTAAVFFDASRGDLLVEGLSRFSPALATALNRAESIKRGRLESENRRTTAPGFQTLDIEDEALQRLESGFGFSAFNAGGIAFARQYDMDRNQTNVHGGVHLHPVVRPGHEAPTVLDRPNRTGSSMIRLPGGIGR
jgi:hypothetical protein